MAWWRPSGRIRSVSIVMIATGVHIALAAILLSQELEPMRAVKPDILEIELAELPPEIEVKPKIEREIEPVSEQEPVVPLAPPAPTIATEPQPPDPPPVPARAENPQPAAPQTMDVLTQLETDPAGPPVAPSLAAAGETVEHPVTPAQVASALTQMHCLKLKRHEEGDCPPPDPFAVAAANAERAIPPERLFGDPRYIAKTVSDKIFEKEAANRFHWPDADLFNDPMAPGAYNARRIRNGQEPLWSQEMRDGFRKSEE